MSKKCPKCGSIRIVENSSWNVSICLACESFLNTIDGKSKLTVFDRITQSPEVLAEKLVYSVMLDYCYEEWYSTLFPDKDFGTKAEAIAATAAKLKEVDNG